MPGERWIAGTEDAWSAIYGLPDEQERHDILLSLFQLLENPQPPQVRRNEWDFHGTVAPGFELPFPSGQGFVPYLVTRLGTGQEVIRILRLVWYSDE